MNELNHRFQNSWAIKLPWAEFIMGVDVKVIQVKCKVCIGKAKYFLTCPSWIIYGNMLIKGRPQLHLWVW
jgi:hypothetical protein